MKKNSIVVALLIISIATISCNKKIIKGEGHSITETRAISEVDIVALNGSENVEIVRSAENKVEISGYHNLVPLYESKLRNGKLILEMDNDYINVKNNNIHIKLYTTGIKGIYMNGSGNVNAKDDIGEQMDVRINGSGDVSFGHNNFTHFDLSINGSGNIKAQKAIAETVYAAISGSGDIEVTVTRYLKAKISGSGVIDYWGDPTQGVDADMSGSGKIRKN